MKPQDEQPKVSKGTKVKVRNAKPRDDQSKVSKDKDAKLENGVKEPNDDTQNATGFAIAHNGKRFGILSVMLEVSRNL